MSNNQIGPIKYTIPEQEVMTCHGCKYHDRSMVCSGMNPKYRNDCKHPDLPKEHRRDGLSFSGNLRNSIYGMVKTPEWCPAQQQTNKS